jgi:hypothetical protein
MPAFLCQVVVKGVARSTQRTDYFFLPCDILAVGDLPILIRGDEGGEAFLILEGVDFLELRILFG